MIDDRNVTFQCLKLIVYRELKMDEISPRLGQLFLHHFPSTHTPLSDRKVLEWNICLSARLRPGIMSVLVVADYYQRLISFNIREPDTVPLGMNHLH